MEPSSLDRINRRTYASRGARRQYGTAAGWLDRGEQEAVTLAVQNAGRGAILDIGVGGGRTAPLLSGVATQYVGIDYTPDLLRVAQRRYPGLDLREMDARALAFPDASFDLVTFSFNGIDSVDLAGRQKILEEVFRVLKPGGNFVFSSLNRDGPSFGESVWAGDAHWRGVLGVLRRLRRAGRGLWRRMLLRPLTQTASAMAVAPLAVHDFGVMAVFTSLHAQLQQLEVLGFIIEAVFDDAQGRKIDPASADSSCHWYYYVARKPRQMPSLTRSEMSEQIAAQ